MKKIFAFLAVVSAVVGFANPSLADPPQLEVLGQAVTPNVSEVGSGSIYFDSTTNLLYLSENGGPYAPLTTNGVTSVTASSPLFSSGGSTPNITCQVASGSQAGCLSAADWTFFSNKITAPSVNNITNPDAEIDLSGWNLYNNSGRATPASGINQDITYTSTLSADSGNGATISYVFHPTQSYLTPLVTCPTGTSVQVAWFNGPTLANNPTATQLKAAYDATPCAVAIATSAITGTASNRQYESVNVTLGNGGDTAPATGTGGVVTGLTLTRNTATPLAGVASFDLGKDAANRQGEGVSTDFTINSLYAGQIFSISFLYEASAGFVLGATSDVQVFIYDITNAVMIPVTPTEDLGGVVSTLEVFTGKFKSSSTSLNYRLIFHVSTQNAASWDLLYDSVSVKALLVPIAVQQAPSLVLPDQPISGSVTDHMAVAWTDGATKWVPATSAFNGDSFSIFGFATNIVGSTADIYIRGSLSGFNFGAFAGYDQYVDPSIPGGLTALPSPLTDTELIMGRAISADTIVIQPSPVKDLITSKGGLLSNAGANNGTGDQVLSVGGNGNALIANSAASLGINWAPAVVAGTGLTYTTATRTLTLSNLAGDVTGAPGTNSIAASVVTGKLITGFVSGAGTVAATDTILQAINKLNGNDGLRAPLASPTFTGDVNSSTGNVLISTIGKGLQVKTGTNAKIGTAVLVAGAVTAANTSVTANSRIFVTSNVDGGTPGWLRVSAKTVGTSFVITSSSATDTSTIAWYIVESIP